MKRFLIVSLSLFVANSFSAQKLDDKIKSIIEFLGAEDYYVMHYDFYIDDLIKHSNQKEKNYLIKLKDSIDTVFIRNELASYYKMNFSKKEIKKIYKFFNSSAGKKIFDFQLDKNIKAFKHLDKTLDSISNIEYTEYKKNESSKPFDPIPINREDGFYATKDSRYLVSNTTKIELVQDPAITFDYIQNARKDYDAFGEEIIIINFTKEGAMLFRKLTENSIGKRIAIVFDNMIIAAPLVPGVIEGGYASITGNSDTLDALLEKLEK